MGPSMKPCGTPGSHFVEPDMGSENGCFVLWLSLIGSDLAWLGSLPRGENQDCAFVCECVCREHVCGCVYRRKGGGRGRQLNGHLTFLNRAENYAEYENKQ